ncbi:MAG: PIG-L family deacetylase [Verrucomicrobiota bacterium]
MFSGTARRFAAGAVLFFLTAAAMAQPVPPGEILHQLRAFDEMGSVLYVAAHPDDENTQLIAYLARGRNYRTAYLSLTRGDGGQNVLGAEMGPELGVLRTQELLAARRVDGGQQFFSRALDFGFSKDYRETLNIWDKQQVLEDMVRVIRTFRPDVMITRFSTQPGGTHGHHTASAVLALEAFKLAGDTNAFAEHLSGLAPWQPKRIFLNAWSGPGGRGVDNATNAPGVLRVDISGNDASTGESFGSIAARSRAMHKTQGFGNFTGFGGGGGPRPERFELMDGEAATNDILDGIDTTWGRVAGGEEIGKLAKEAIANFNPTNCAATVPVLLEIRRKLAALPVDAILNEKQRALDCILQSCLGMTVQTAIPQASVVPGGMLAMKHSVSIESGPLVRWLAVRYPSIHRELNVGLDLKPAASAARDSSEELPANQPLTQPYWLQEPVGTGMFRVADQSLIGMPENPPAFPVEWVFDIQGQTLVIPDQPKQYPPAGVTNAFAVPLRVIAPVAIRFASEVELFSPGADRPVEVDLTAEQGKVSGTLRLEVPEGWRVRPAEQSFKLKASGDRKRVRFTVRAPLKATSATLVASAEVNHARFDRDRIVIGYEHMPPQILQPVASQKAVSLDLEVRAKAVGYIAGAGDRVPEALAQMGCSVKELKGTDLTPDRLKKLDSVVAGIRAFNVRKDLAPHLPALFDWVKSGGTLVIQYNNPNGLQTNVITPVPLTLSGDRVTDETAPMTFLAADHPVLKSPNKITESDFSGWVQERGLYFPNQWDPAWEPILACNDPGESPKKGGLLVAQYGKGYVVYTGLAFFRQLPAGVPGAYRLFGNMISLGK